MNPSFSGAPKLLILPVRQPPRILRPLTNDQRARVDALSIPRWYLTRCPIPRWSPEGEKREAALAAIRHEVTVAEKREAWRTLFQQTGQGRV